MTERIFYTYADWWNPLIWNWGKPELENDHEGNWTFQWLFFAVRQKVTP